MIRFRNAALWVVSVSATIGFLILAGAIIGYMLPLSASEALNGAPKGAHELGFWLLLLISLPLWLAGSWSSTLAIVKNAAERSGRRRAIWAFALLISALAMAATNNTFGFGDLFNPI
ncbi:hypothetical protein IED13_09455 [Bosea sp. SSUT16]|uniref:Uncharacterized protein n=1 Tax=Bosea spartocytisi TaxID=2773451 RepID=A0A927I029_9HYPH|nr:hypothetical protein [Bosea spartocytisi]MBD3845922.1 hypothetical protein [Bosea spartocytisi]MCT4474709.1 hypothetical protein [Bosea spartocytisi]